MTRTAFYPGSFDPLTNGHLDIMSRALAQFDRLVVGVGAHHGKTPLLELETRLALIEEVARPLAAEAGGEIAAVSFSGLVVDAARAAGAGALVRGLRDASDFDYELRMSRMNRSMAREIDSVFFAAAPDVSFISSTLIRQIAAMGGDIAAFVPAASAAAVRAAGAR
jgi:pantetheine-phosphate adenylyltransferase